MTANRDSNKFNCSFLKMPNLKGKNIVNSSIKFKYCKFKAMLPLSLYYYMDILY